MGEMRWNEDKTHISIEGINFVSNDIYEAVLGALRGLIKTNKLGEKTPMTPDSTSRLLKAARAYVDGVRGYIGPNWLSSSSVPNEATELEAAVKACEATETVTVWSGTMADVQRAVAADTLTDQQRRLGLRDTRHVTPGNGNWDYD